MSLIEGIGDEVILVFVIVLIFIVSALVTLLGNVPSSHSRARQHSNVRDSRTVIQNPRIVIRRIDESGTNSNSLLPRQELEVHFTSSGLNENHAVRDNEETTDIPEGPVIEEVNANCPNTQSDCVRTEADGSTVEDSRVVEDVRTEADGSAVVDNDASSNEEADELHSPTPSAPSFENTERSETGDVPPLGPGEISLRLKYLDDTERIVVTSLSTKIDDFKKKHFREDIQSNKIVRLIFAGRLLQNSSTIQQCRIVDQSVVHVQVLPAPTTQTTPVASQDTDLDLGRWLWPLLTVIIGLCWLSYFKYPDHFNTMSTGLLMLFSSVCCYFLSRP